MRRLLAILAILIVASASAETFTSPQSGSTGTSTAVNGVPNAMYTATTGGGATCAVTPAIINYNTLLTQDTDSAVTTGAGWKFTVPAMKGGLYQICATAVLSPVAGTDYKLTLFKGGSARLPIVEQAQPNTNELILNGCVFDVLAPAEFVDVRCSTNTGTAAVTVNSGMWIQIARIAP